VPTVTTRTPALAYAAALIALLVIGVAYRPVLRAWYQFHSRPPAVAVTVELLRSQSAERQREGLASAALTRPVADEVLTAVSDLAFGAPDPGIRQQAAQYLAGVAQQRSLPADMLRRLPALTPEMDRGLATTYATLIDRAAQWQPTPPNALEFLDALIEQGDPSTRNVAILALGQVGFHHGLDDARIARLTGLAAYRDPLGNEPHGADAAWALKLVGQRRPLPPETLDVLVELMRHGRDAGTRERAVDAVATQMPSSQSLADAVEAVLEDPDPRVRGAAQSLLHELETRKPADLEQALQLAADENEPSTRRLRALQRLLQQTPADERVRALVGRLARDGDAVLRAGVVSMGSALPHGEAEALFAAGLEDTDPRVRAAAVLPLVARRAAEGEDAQAQLIRTLLGDATPEVQRNVLLAIRVNQLKTEAVRAALRDMEPADARLGQERLALLDTLVRASRTPFQRFLDAALKPENYGAFAFTAVAAAAVLLCVPFLFYFVARFFVYLSARQWRALGALGVVAVWVVASFALGWAFFLGVLIGGGHNSQPPLSAQFMVLGVLLLLVGVYALLGYGLRRLVRN
jgi:HEAT repeat protein